MKSTANLPPRKIKILVSVVYGNLFLGSCYGLMAPFFPAEAELKGATASHYGFIFGIYQLTMFLVSPILGRMIGSIGTSFFMKTGTLMSGVCVILFGALNYVPSGIPFVTLAFIIRAADAIGASAYFTASYALVGSQFSNTIGRAMSIVETAFSFGLAAGPALGGLLYGLGGFTTPFFTIGTLLLSGTLVNFYLLSDTENDLTFTGSHLDTKKLIFHLDFFLDILTVIACFITLGFNEVTLEPHLRQFKLTSSMVGGIFLISGLIDAVSSFFWGYFSDKVPNAQILTCLSCLFYIVCFLIIAPVPFLNFSPLLWVIILSQVLLGFGMSGEIMCSFTHGMKNAVERGFPEDVATYGVVSSLLLSGACFGGFLGPSIGGILMDHLGYQQATVVIMAIQIALVLLVGSRLVWNSLMKRKASKTCSNGVLT